MRRFLAASAAALLLTACTTTQSPQITQGKAIAGLWSSLKAASEAADVAVKAGALKGPAAATVANDLTEATTLISAADAAYHLNPTTDTTSATVQAASLISQVLCLVQPTPICATTPSVKPVS